MEDRSTESQEMYLKTIYLLKKKNGAVYSTDIADESSCSKPSVTRAIKRLRANGYIKDTGKREIELTEKGYEKANKLCERYEFFREILVEEGIAPDRAHETACRVEHVIPNDVYETLKEKRRT